MNAKMFNGMFGQISPSLCRISLNGDIAVKTSTGYKSYNVDKARATNCDQFAFDLGEDMFFIIPTNKVERGDIVLIGGKPRCVIDANTNEIRVYSYEDSTIQTVVPERFIFMGNTYFYGKIVSMFGLMGGAKSGTKNIMKYMLLSQMLGGKNVTAGNANPLAMMMLMGGGNNPFDGMFDFDLDEDAAATTESEGE